jgi:hypothetical protein
MAGKATRTIYQFPISHFAEKARWCLDLLGPIVAPPESPWARIPSALPLDVQALRRELRARPGGQWVMERYRCDRARPFARRTEGATLREHERRDEP